MFWPKPDESSIAIKKVSLGLRSSAVRKTSHKIFARFQQMRPRIPGAIRLFWRYHRALEQRRLAPDVAVRSSVHGFSARVISLVERLDRRAIVTEHLATMRIDFKFFDARKDSVPLAGGGDSHASVLSDWNPMKTNWLMILEDDIEFLVDRVELLSIIEDFLSNPALDVLCLAHNTFCARVPVSKHLSISQHSQTTAAYITKVRARETLVRTFEEAAGQVRKGEPPERWGLDILWTRHQRRDLIFAIPRKKVARQRASYSDIEERFVDYGV